MSETLATYIDRWVSKAASGGLRNPLLKMPVKRFRLLQQFELDDLLKGRRLSIGTSSDPIARNLYKNYDEKIRERGEHTGFLTHGSIEVILAGTTTKGNKRSALMPVWLQRIDLRKQSEKIVAQPVDDPLWDLNPELPAVLKPLGIDTRHGPREERSRLLQWLSAQIGNRGRVDTATSYIGCFSSQHLVIRERLTDGRWRRAFAQNHAVAAKLFGAANPADWVTPHSQTQDSEIEDLGLVLPIDDSQLRVVQFANAGQSMVVQGPPGTGKSQTIANLVANALWRGRRVLVVCDKRTAIRQVEERLVKCNLGAALINLHDEGLDKKAFLQQAANVFQTRNNLAARHVVNDLAELRNELNQRVLDGQSIVHPALGIPRFDALAGLIRLREQLRNAPSINVVNWQSLSRDRLSRILDSLSEWESLDPIADNNDPTWNAIQWTVFREDPNSRVEVMTVVESLRSTLNRLVELRENAAVVGYNSDFENLPSIRELGYFAALVASRPKCHATIMDDLSLSIDHLDRLEAAQIGQTKLLEKGHPGDLRCGPLPSTRYEAEEILAQEKVRSWAELIDRKDHYRSVLVDLTRIDANYSRIATQRGWISRPRQSERVAQMAQVKELLDTHVAIPARWWSQAEGSPSAGLARWRRELDALAGHAQNSPSPLDIAALDRVPDATWPDFQAVAEDGFNAVSYCLRYRNDRRVKLALKQIYPNLPTGGKCPWLDLVLHAVKAREILLKIKEASVWHFDLKGLTDTCLSRSVGQTNFLTDEYLARFEMVQKAAVLTERLRLRNDLFMLENPVWTAHWETAGLRQVTELDTCFFAWKEWVAPNPTDDNVEHSQAWLEERINRISRFLSTHLTADGDNKLAVLAAWDDYLAYFAHTKKLEELGRYRQITEVSPDAVNWERLRSVITWRDEFRKIRGSRRLDLDHAEWKQLRSLSFEFVTKIEQDLKNLGRFFGGIADDSSNFDGLAARLDVIIAGMPLLDTWCRKAEWNAKVTAWPELQPFWNRILEGQTPTKHARPLFCYNLIRLCAPHISPNGPELAAKLKTFAIKDEQLEQWSIAELRDRLAKKQEDAQARHRMGFAEIRRLAGLSRVRGSVRELCEANLPLLLDLKPAWLMSPVSLANLMDLQRLADHGHPFDLVIFDEASQIPVTEGLLPLGFAKQTIIVGDDKQLPPTMFFTTAAQIDEDELDELGESESLIEEFHGSLFSPMLMAHYRSETPDLISFSNREFYAGKLEMYPPTRVTGLGRRYHFVSNGIFDSGRSRTNAEEARAVVRLVEDHVRRHGDHSLGVVAMNAEQMDLIESLLISAPSDVREFCSDEEKFFIRNLETVQGDEMDRIIVSLTYGRNQEGKFNAAILGPLVKKGGERRLNVALSRSRTGMIIVTSMTTQDLDQSDAQSVGFACLKRLLTELETTHANGNFGLSDKRFEKRRDGGTSEMIYCESPFEEQVVEYLENQGYQVRCQFGVQRPDGLGSFRIDIVVVEDGHPLIAIECDGAAYHRSLSARTRDRSRQSQLERLGWRFHRVWSTNWWLYPDAEKEAMVASISNAQRQRPPTRHGPALGAVHSIAARRAELSSPDRTDPFAPISPSKDGVPSTQASQKQDVLIDELGNLFEQDSASAPINNPEPTPSPRPKQPTATQPVLLQDWSRRPGWPDTVVGKRVMWGGAWGVITKTERDGKSVFFRDERTKEVLELSADFIRMRSGSSE